MSEVRTRVLLGGCVVVALTAAAAGQPTFQRRMIDRWNTGDGKAVADFDGDGLTDVALAGRRLMWYRSPGFGRRVISEAAVEFSTDMQAADVDGDGDPDLIVPDGGIGAISWFENPRPRRSPLNTGWNRHTVGFHGTWAHDVEVARAWEGGPTVVLSRGFGITKMWVYEGGFGPWREILVTARPGEGADIGDIDRDGDADIALDGVWLENPGGDMTAPWTQHLFALGWPERVGVRIAEINGDGRPDIVVAPSESEGLMAWYEAPEDPRTPIWPGWLMARPIDYVHTFQIADVDRDGKNDVVFAEMEQSSRKRIGYLINPGHTGRWPMYVVAATGAHNIRVADMDGNGRLDIIGTNWQSPPLSIWLYPPLLLLLRELRRLDGDAGPERG